MWADKAFWAFIFCLVVVVAIAIVNVVESITIRKIEADRAKASKNAVHLKARELRDNDNIIFNTVQESQNDFA